VADVPPNPIEKPGYRLEFHDEFDGPGLDESKWLPWYLPQWSSRERSRARYSLADGALTLTIDPDQPPWCPEFDGAVKCSSLQTGLFAGPIGSRIGQHRFADGLTVREEQPTVRAYVPRFGYFELRARATLGPDHLAAMWLIGFEESPEDSGEITVMEIFGRNVTPAGTRLGHGIKRVNDPRLKHEFHEDLLPFDPGDYHLYAAEWTPEGVVFFLDNRKLGAVTQSPAYPMQVMLNVYELPGTDTPAAFQPAFTVDYVRAWRPIDGYRARGG
jgi:hypothetical protein